MRKGFTFPYKNIDVFVETNKNRKTNRLASEILRKMLLPDSPDRRRELLYWLQKAELEENDCCICIKTKNATIVDPENKTIIIAL